MPLDVLGRTRATLNRSACSPFPRGTGKPLNPGGDIEVSGGMAKVVGVDQLKGAPVMATDLRASVSMILAGLAAEGETVLSRVYHLDRGYEKVVSKFNGIGAKIERVSS